MTSRKAFIGGCLLGGITSIVLLFAVALGGTVLFRDLFVAKMTKDLKAPVISTGSMADYSLPVNTLDGAPFDMATFKGKAIFLNFWSPNCAHCESELPNIEELYRMCTGFGVEFMCVAVESPEAVPGLIEKYGLTVPIYILNGTRPTIFDSESAPITFFITKDGEIALRIRGGAKWDDLSVAALLKILSMQEES